MPLPGEVPAPVIRPLTRKQRGRSSSHIDNRTFIEISTDSIDCRLFFSTDGDDPDPYSRRRDGRERTFRYRSPFNLKAGYRTVKAIAVNRLTNEESPVTTRSFRVDKALVFEEEPPTESETDSCLDTNRTDELISDILRNEHVDSDFIDTNRSGYDSHISYPTDVTTSPSSILRRHHYTDGDTASVDELFSSSRYYGNGEYDQYADDSEGSNGHDTYLIDRHTPYEEDLFQRVPSPLEYSSAERLRSRSRSPSRYNRAPSPHRSPSPSRGRAVSPSQMRNASPITDLSATKDYVAYHKKYSALPQLDWSKVDPSVESILQRRSQGWLGNTERYDTRERLGGNYMTQSLDTNQRIHQGHPPLADHRARDPLYRGDEGYLRSSLPHRSAMEYIDPRTSYQPYEAGHHRHYSDQPVPHHRSAPDQPHANSIQVEDLDHTGTQQEVKQDVNASAQLENEKNVSVKETEEQKESPNEGETNVKTVATDDLCHHGDTNNVAMPSDGASDSLGDSGQVAPPLVSLVQEKKKDEAAEESVPSPRPSKKEKDKANRKLEKATKKKVEKNVKHDVKKNKTEGPSVKSGSNAMNFTNQSGTQINFWGMSPRSVFGEKVKDVKDIEQAAQRMGSGQLALPSASHSGNHPDELSAEADQLFESASRGSRGSAPIITEPPADVPSGDTVMASQQQGQESIGGFFRKFFKGWGSDDDDKKMRKSGKPRTTAESGKSYEEIKRECQEKKCLWEDPDFPATDSSLYYQTRPAVWPLEWKRPQEICSNPQLVVGGANRVDVNQGILGDCWLLAAIASLTTNNKLLHQVVPQDQTFGPDYAGVFRFRFWQYGRWVEVCVDDRLPTSNNKLVYLHSTEGTEFWSALLEKAYAKLAGSYEALSSGLASESMTDFTGGVVERFNFRDELPSNMFHIMTKAMERGSLMSCSIDADPGKMEAELENGLIMGHAYSVTAAQKVDYDDGDSVELVRVRNPWGNECEWKGPWSDKSEEWKDVPEEDRQELGLTFDHDGEFWMSFKDFSANFQRLEICNLTAESLGDTGDDLVTWSTQMVHGSWKKKVNAGGCRNNKKTFWINPQYFVTITDTDEDDDEDMGTLVIGLMQKDRRAQKQAGGGNLTIGYDIYKVSEDTSGTLSRTFFATNRPVASSPSYINMREVCGRHKLPVGNYVIIPTTFGPGEEANFLVRIITEKENSLIEANSDTVEVEAQRTMQSSPAASQAAEAMFSERAGEDGEIDAEELKFLLDSTFQKDFKFDGFHIDTCRSIIALHDIDQTGKLGKDEFSAVWNDLNSWKAIFQEHDTDSSGHFNSYELREAVLAAGYQLSNGTFNALATRYSNRDGFVEFDDFVSCIVKMRTMFAVYKAKEGSGQTYSLDEFIQMTMYS